jgi:hypothetical protein
MTKDAQSGKFGTFAGVFTPTILTIIGVIMYLRMGWVIGTVGFGSALVIIMLGHVATLTTGFSIASIATNTRVGRVASMRSCRDRSGRKSVVPSVFPYTFRRH